MYMTLKVLPSNETFVISDPFRIADGLAEGPERDMALDPVFLFLSQCGEGLSRLFGDVVLFVSFSDAFVEPAPDAPAAPFREFFPSPN